MADTEIIALATTMGTTMGSVLTYLATRKKARVDDGAAFRKDLLDRVKLLEGRLDAERHECQDQLDVLRSELQEEQRRCDRKMESLRGELSAKLSRQAASIRAEYKRDLEEASDGK